MQTVSFLQKKYEFRGYLLVICESFKQQSFMKHLWNVLLVAYVLSASPCLAQTKKQLLNIDSLETLLQAPLSDSNRVKIFNELAWLYRNSNYETSLTYGTKAKDIARRIGYKKGLATAYNRVGLIHKSKGEDDLALGYYRQALVIEKDINHQYGISRAKNQIGIIFMRKRRYKEAIQYFEECIHILKKINKLPSIATKKMNIATCYKNLNNLKYAIQFYLEAIDIYKESKKGSSQIGKCYLGLGILYRRTKNLRKSREYCLSALMFFKKRGNKKSLAKVYNELGTLCLGVGGYQAALEYYQKVLQLKKALGTTKKIQGIYNNLGLAYLEQSNLDSAKVFFLRSLDLSTKKKDSLNLALTYHNLGLMCQRSQEYKKAISYFHKSLKLYGNTIERNYRKNTLESLSSTYAKIEQYNKAFKYFDQYKGARDSLEKSFREAMVYKDSYEKEKKKSELLEKDKKIKDGKLFLQTVMNYFFGIGLLLSLMIVFAIIKNYQERRKVRQGKEKIDDLMREQEFLALSKMLEGQETERNRIAQDLHDRLGGMLSVVKLQFAALGDSLGLTSTEDTEVLQKTGQLIDNACDAVRQVSHNISSKSLERFGLISALDDLAENIKATGTLDIDVIDVGFDNRRLPAKYETQMYRVVQELVGNVLKHANASEVEIQLYWKDKESNLHISVEDNGKGFNVGELDKGKGLGMGGVKNRVKSLSGEFKIDSNEGAGTMIMIDIPLLEKDSAIELKS